MKLVQEIRPKDAVLERLRSMDERTLRKEVIIPLMSAMGFSNIEDVHGPSERGKDIIYTAKDNYGDDSLEVCQVKNDKFSGRAGSRSNTLAVLNQILTARNTRVLNPITGLKELPQRVVLFSTYPLPEKDTSDAGDLLEQIRVNRCKVIGPDALVALIQRHIPKIYDDYGLPGQGIIRSLRKYVDIHHEATAFELASDRHLSDFYVNLAFSYMETSEGISSVGSGHKRKKAKVRISGKDYDWIREAQKTFPGKLGLLPIIRVQKVEGGGNENEETGAKHEVFDILELNLRKFLKRIHKEVSKLSCKGDIKETSQALEIIRAARYLVGILLSRVLAEVKLGDEVLEDFTTREMMPEAILNFDQNLCVVGDVGTGKTSLARVLARMALLEGINCIYFPCSRVVGDKRNLKHSICRFIKYISESSSDVTIKKFVERAKLIILDGCDEAVNFGPSLGEAINLFAFRKKVSVKVKSRGDVDLNLSPDLKDKLIFKRKSKTLQVVKPLTQLDFRVLTSMNSECAPVCKAVSQLATTYREENPRVIVTSRIAEPLDLDDAFLYFEIVPFSDGQIITFLHNWFRGRTQAANDVIGFLDRNPYVKDICRNPMICTVVAALHENGYDLPRSKAELYEKRFQLLINKWDRTKGVPPRNVVKDNDKLMILMQLAYYLHREHRRTFQLYDVDKIWNRGFSELYPESNLRDVIQEMQLVNNVILPVGRREYSLGHLSFQEFLVARYAMQTQKQQVVLERYFDPWWKNVMLFYAGLCGDISGIMKHLQNRYGISLSDQMLRQMINEARYTSAELKDFLRESLAEGLLSYGEEDNDEDW